MARIKYYYDTETCKYERVKVSTWDVLLNLLGFLTIALLIAAGLLFAFNKYFESPKELSLRKENEELFYHYQVLEKQWQDVNQMITSLQERDDNIYREYLKQNLSQAQYDKPEQVAQKNIRIYSIAI